MESELNNDALIRQLGGCGLFQVVLTTLGSLPYTSAAFSAIFMSFGLVDPGWRCLDNITTNANNSYSHYNNHHHGGIDTTIDVNRRGELFNQTNTQMTIYGDVSDNYTESCVGFNTMSCQNIEFSPEASTIVSEWGLVCDKSWIPSIIITIETVGYLLGGFLGGYLGDKYGRKRIFYTNALIHGVLNLLCVVCTSWQMFAAVRFLMGVSYSAVFVLTVVYTAEFVSPKWRAVLAGLPLWTIGCLIFFIVTFVFKNWKYLHVFNGLFSLLCLLPAFILPESLRWLIVMEKSEQSLEAVGKISRMNKVSAPNETCLTLIESRKRKQILITSYSFINLFRKGLRQYTLVLGYGFFCVGVLYFATSFGLSSLPGDFYVNAIIVYLCEFPGNVIAWFAPNILGRRTTAILANIITCLAFLAVVFIDRFGSASAQEHGVLAIVILARTMACVSWYALVTSASELYPAVARSNSSGWRLFVLGLATMISPYFIPGDGNDLFIPYIIMAILPLTAAILLILIPETKGKPMVDDLIAVDA